MAANPSLLGTSTSSRTLTGVGIALLVVATIGGIAVLTPRLKDEFREDIFSRRQDSAPRAASAPAFVPRGSLAPGEMEVKPAMEMKPVVEARPADPLPPPQLKKAIRLAKRPHVRAARHREVVPTPSRVFSSPRTWRPGMNHDAPSSSPTDPQPG